MNHELIHVVQSDIASGRGSRVAEHSSSARFAPRAESGNAALQLPHNPRFTARRAGTWRARAVFSETWMGGGLGRAQGGYDEMVFRAMVRDNAHFYDPLGLASRGSRGRFPDRRECVPLRTRFFTWLAYDVFAREGCGWLRRDEESERNLSDQFEQVFGVPSSRRGRNGSRSSTSSSAAISPRFVSSRLHRSAIWSGAAMGSMSRMYYDETTGHALRGVSLPWRGQHVGALNTRDGSHPAARRHQGGDALSGRVVCVSTPAAEPPSTPTTIAPSAT